MARRRSKEPGGYVIGQPLGRGGEAAIHGVTNHPDLVAKLYHQLPTAEQIDKLDWMLDHPPHDPSMPAHRSIAWPTDLAIEWSGSVLGFVMPKVENAKPLIEVYNPSRRKRLGGDWSTRRLYRTAANLAVAVDAIHQAGYVIGDLNESNVLVTPEALVTVIDTDSFQVVARAENGSQVFPCKVGKPEFTPPELQGKTLANVVRTPEQDRFALGVLVFLLVMEGNHPFRNRWTGTGDPPSLEESIGKGYYPYQTASLPIAPPATAFDPSALHPSLRALCLRCFVEGHQRPDRRPTGAEWARALAEAERDLVRCSNGHLHPKTATTCPYCQQVAVRKTAPNPTQPAPPTFPSPTPVFPTPAPAPVRPAPVWGPPPKPQSSQPPKKSRRWLFWTAAGIGGWRLLASWANSTDQPPQAPYATRTPGAPARAAATSTRQPPRPTSTTAPLGFGFTNDFDYDEPISNTGIGSTLVRNGRLTITVTGPGVNAVGCKEPSSGGRDIRFAATLADTSGWGDVVLRVRDLSEDADWDFAVNPTTRTWMVYRRSIYTSEWFTWIEPRSYSQMTQRELEVVEVRLVDGKPRLLINANDVSTPLGVQMPEIAGSVTVGLGAGIDPNLAPVDRAYFFTVEFSQARLEALL